jgi:hypothetical protein
MFTWTEGRTDVQTDRQTYSESNNHVLAIFLCGYTKKEVMSGCIACIGGVRNAFRLLTGITQETFVSWTPINWREETVAWSLCLVKIIFTCQMGISSTAEGSWCAKEQIQFVDWRPTRNRRPIIASRLLLQVLWRVGLSIGSSSAPFSNDIRTWACLKSQPTTVT